MSHRTTSHLLITVVTYCSSVDSYIVNLNININYNWPAPPDDPQGIRVASGFEFSVCLSVCLLVCLLVLDKFSNLFAHYKATGVRKNIVRMNTNVPCRRLDQIEI